jgi:hypothetical protein
MYNKKQFKNVIKYFIAKLNKQKKIK